MEKWSEVQINDLRVLRLLPDCGKQRNAAADHIRELQEAVEEMVQDCRTISDFNVLAIIRKHFWTINPFKDEDPDDGAYRGGTWPCNGDNW